MGGAPQDEATVVQECAAGLVRIRRGERQLAFAAPPLVRSGPVDEADVERVASSLGIDAGDIVDAQWADNGPGWVAAMLRDAEAVLALRPATSRIWRSASSAGTPTAAKRRGSCGRS